MPFLQGLSTVELLASFSENFGFLFKYSNLAFRLWHIVDLIYRILFGLKFNLQTNGAQCQIGRVRPLIKFGLLDLTLAVAHHLQPPLNN